MKIINQFTKFLLILLLTGACTITALLIYTKLRLNNIPIDSLTAESIDVASGFSEEPLDLKKEYFDDLDAIWGKGTETGEFVGEAFNSEYAPRSIPHPISHPIEINHEKIAIKPVKRSEIKLDPLSASDPLSTSYRSVDENYQHYGELIGGFFSNKGEKIVSLKKADVDMDSVPEKLITTANFGANHPPHHGYVVKNNVIIASIEFITGYIKPAKDNNGFYLKDPVSNPDALSSYLEPMCCPKGYRIYRVVYEDNRFIPVWEQNISYLQFKESE